MEKISFFLCCFLLTGALGTSIGQELDANFYRYSHRTMSPDGKGGDLALGQYKGKIIILDFWNRFCSSCLRQMPKMYGLQQRFGEKLQIVPVTNDKAEQVKAVYDRQKGGNFEIKLPTVHTDTMLTQMFGVKGYPTAVWIDAAGKVLAITYGSAVDTETVRSVLDGDYSLLRRVARAGSVRSVDTIESGNGISDGASPSDLLRIRLRRYDPAQVSGRSDTVFSVTTISTSR